tara:strand:+ start:724 stop:3354 length:2631 start_codon:yes stop_codon:yes gene_type:complete
MSTYLGQANLKAKAFFSRPGAATLAALAHTRGDLHKPGETNSIGLVMMGAVEFVGPRDIAPSGTNREYGYWRGGYNKTFLNKFDQAFFPLEGSGIYAGVPQVTITQKATGGGDGVTCAEGVGEGGCTWIWMGDSYGWELYVDQCGDGGKPGCGCGGTNPSTPGDWEGDMQSFDCVGGTTAGSAGGVGTNVGYAEWTKAGTLNESLGQEAPQQRSLFLSKRSFISAGSGVDLSTSLGYSVYAKVVPSGDITGTVMIAQHKQNPAQFILGCDYDGKYYVRSDHSVSGVNVPVVAKSEKDFERYQYPAHVIGVYASGDSKLRIYVNGKEEGVSAPFVRDKKRGSNTNVVLGKREFGLAERGFTGWVDEAGVSSRSFEPSEIKTFHDNTFNITDLIFNTKVTPTGDSGLSGRDFGDTGLDALNADYVELVVDSGVVGDLNPTGAKGGAFDQNMWGQANHAVSSVLTFDLTEVPERFHQLTDLSIDLWVEHSTNHPSGADLSTRLINKKSTDQSRNLSWHPSGISVPSGLKRLVSISHPLEHEAYYRDGESSFMQDFDDHRLEIVVKYPKTSLPYDANFKIYSTKVAFSGFDSMAHFNTQQGLVEVGVIKGHSITNIDGDIISYATGDRSLTMVSVGASPVLSSGIMNMFIDTSTADQALNLVLNQDSTTDMGDTSRGYMFGNAAIEMSGRRMNLYTVGGLINAQMPLFLKTKDPFSFTSPVLHLEIAGSELSFPRAQKTMPLFFTASKGFGSPSGNMNLVMPKVIAPVFVGKRLLYIKGLMPVGDIPLYLEATKQTINTTPLYTKGPRVYSAPDSMNLFVKQKDFFGEAKIKAIPSIAGTGNTPLFIKGFASPTGAMNFVMPNVLGSGTNTRELYIRGYQ